MNIKHSLRILGHTLAIAAALSLAACGGGGGGDTGTGDSVTGGIIGGTGVKGPVANATVTAYAISGGSLGAKIGSGATDASGNFSVSMGTYSGPVMLQLSGGSYTDEATGTTMPMASGDVMTAVIPTVAAGSTVSGIRVTPLTSMAQTMAQHLSGGMTDANIASANTAIGSYFLVSDILHVQPMNPLVAGAGSGASQDAVNYGMAMAAMTQYAKNLGMTSSSAMVTAMMNDASDSVMDGMMGSSSVMMGGMGMGSAMPSTAGTTGLAAAMSTFAASSQNRSGVTVSTMQPLVTKLSTSNGILMGAGSKPSGNGSLGGTVFSGLMQRATVTALAVTNGTPGAQIASTTTDAQGNFTMSLGTYGGPVMLQASGTTYIDEATGQMMSTGSNDVMTAVITAVASGASVNGVMVTPLTSMAQVRAKAMSGGMTDANIAAANAALGNYFSVSDILHTRPLNPLLAGSASGASQDARTYGMTLAAMSQYAKGLNMTNSSAMVTAMVNDAADGVMDGKTNGSPISMPMGGMLGGGMMAPTAGTSSLAAAMASFMNSGANASGLTAADMAALVQKLTNSDGRI